MNYKKVALLSILLLCLNCSVNKKPEFLSIDNIKTIESTSTHIILSADALFNNPSNIGGELKTDAIKVLVNDNEVATVSSNSFEVPPNSQFSIPLKANIPIGNVFSNKNLSNLIESLFSKKIKVQYLGEIKYRVLGISYAYKVNKTETIKIKL